MCQSVVGDNVRLNDVPSSRDESLDWHKTFGSVGVVFEVIDGRVLQLLGKSVSQDMSYDVRGVFVRVYA